VLGINFGCFDIIKSTKGEYVFLECNPNGQWLWIEKIIKIGIARALAHMLLGASGHKTSAPEMIGCSEA
jgi:glutathione synthase/RimK-type ligase-like ATP-grasp enzyme